MLTCKQLVENSSDYLDARLSLRGRLSVRLHLAMCTNCRRFLRQMKLTRRVLILMPEAPIAELDHLAKRLAEQIKDPADR